MPDQSTGEQGFQGKENQCICNFFYLHLVYLHPAQQVVQFEKPVV